MQVDFNLPRFLALIFAFALVIQAVQVPLQSKLSVISD